MSALYDANRSAWDRLVVQKHAFTKPVPDDQLRDPVRALDGFGWIDGAVAGLRVLCLAAGGGKYGVLFAAAGADVTVVDLSPKMLALDRQVAAEHRLTVRTIEASMADLSVLPAAGFDFVAQPVSTCYVPNLARVYREVARVLRIGGLYISQHKQPTSLQAELSPSGRGYEVVEPYYRKDPLPPAPASWLRECGTLEFLHRWEQIIGGLCRSGFVVEDLIEPRHADEYALPGSFAHRARYFAPYVRVKARRVGAGALRRDAERTWTG